MSAQPSRSPRLINSYSHRDGKEGASKAQGCTKGSRAALPVINMLGTALKKGANGIGGQHGSLDVGHERRHLLSEDQRQGGATVKKRMATVEGSAAEQPCDGHEFGKSCCSLKEACMHTALPFHGLLRRVAIQEGDGG